MSSESGRAAEGLGEAALRHESDLRAFVRMRMGRQLASREMSVDIVQSVFRELAVKQDGFAADSEAGLRRWLFSAAAHKILERARYHAAERRHADRELADPDGLEEVAHRLTPTRQAVAREELERLETALDQLSERHREVLSLVRVAGWSHDEVAAHLDITPTASRQLLRRAVVRLASVLEPDGDARNAEEPQEGPS